MPAGDPRPSRRRTTRHATTARRGPARGRGPRTAAATRSRRRTATAHAPRLAAHSSTPTARPHCGAPLRRNDQTRRATAATCQISSPPTYECIFGYATSGSLDDNRALRVPIDPGSPTRARVNRMGSSDDVHPIRRLVAQLRPYRLCAKSAVAARLVPPWRGRVDIEASVATILERARSLWSVADSCGFWLAVGGR
jgi:hypothetical protein